MRRPDVPSASIGGFGRLWLVILTAVAVLLGTGSSGADPAADALARMNELSREAERLTEQLYTAEIDLEAKTVAQQAAEERHRADLVASETAGAELAAFQSAVDDAAAASYMAGSTGSLSAVLIAASPQRLIYDLALKAVLADQMDEQMTAHRAAMTRWAGATRASQASADQARSAAAQATALRADLQAKQSRLRRQIDAVETQYRDLTPQQQAVLADPGPVPPPPPQDPAVLAMPDVVVPPAGGATVVQAAMSRIGSPYSWGASGPGAFDCSGLIKWAFLQEGKSLPRSSQALAAGGQPVAIDSLQPGDIVTFYADASHAGIYIGDGNMVHASTYGTPVKVAPISSAPIYNARRY
ncbi:MULTISPECIES: peptidoglycan hydrolase RipC [Mycolicibacterium]|uniref:Endopeptidase n=1 Tax=Mycolicibacterium bacteremicum TaxID=564198 RepID=A0A1W9Z3J9_MYCBA|nr:MULTISPECIES: peptidoglycan hydrolase RipC [Mycolicibacterium]MCV7432661.1 C40 family peptidase [Mycolicibacterium bacteremicum]ORA06916.1 endopeptidase [Mycolicibacterium bacteremicum]QVI28296.1 peptidoglycan hydrolase RipC [Mycolicibacterium neoaurum]